MTSPTISVVADPEIASETTSTEAINTVTSTTSTTSTTIATTATTNGYVNRWVKNLLGTPLTEAHVSLLVHGPNFAVALRHPYGEYITKIEQACIKLEPHNAENLELK